MCFESFVCIIMRLQPGSASDPAGALGACSAPPGSLSARTFVVLFVEVV